MKELNPLESGNRRTLEQVEREIKDVLQKYHAGDTTLFRQLQQLYNEKQRLSSVSNRKPLEIN